MLHQTPDGIAKKNGWRIHTDGVHLNSRRGKVLAELVQEFIEHGRTRGFGLRVPPPPPMPQNLQIDGSGSLMLIRG